MRRLFCGVIFALVSACGGDDSLRPPIQPSDSLASIRVTPDRVGIGGTFALSATGTFASGQTTDVTALATWQVTDPSVLEISARGFVRALRSGTTAVTASYQGITGTQQITTFPCVSWGIVSSSGGPVIWVGESVLWMANAYNGCLVHVASVHPHWESSNPAVVAVSYSPAWGSYTATLKGQAPGTSLIRANGTDTSLKDSQATAIVTVVRRPPPDALFINGTDLIALGQVVAFQAQAEWLSPIDRNDDVTAIVLWKTSDRSIARINAGGELTPLRIGKVIVSAELDGKRTDLQVSIAR